MAEYRKARCVYANYKGEEVTEELDLLDEGEAMEAYLKVVAHFNDTLRPHERSRIGVSAEWI